MAKMIRVRNVPQLLYEELARTAKARGETLSDYVLRLLEQEVVSPPLEDLFRRIASRRPVDPGRPASDIIREGRAGRERP